ncbi:MFS transporter [Myroides sp. WP-1]|uniref:MFS transporter n=1 Tax=Myroides sp. WP-1 TaxID=2759944 RepID=UPI0015F7D398|nr:MFS transporter [Myroides sp. WP-1]MBB1140079.1 MFS transporter [Myroides sp. WP-1]
MYNQGLFYSWVPKPVMLLLIVVIALIFFGVNGIYTPNITYLVGSTGAMSEYYLWANYACVVGMGTVMPLIVRIKARFRTKEILVVSLTGIALLFVVMGTTHQPQVIIGASFLIGVFKMLGMMEVVLPLMFILSKDGNRGRFYSIFYTVVLIVTQVAGYYITKISYYANWQFGYLVYASICLVAALICIVFQHNQRFMRKVPLYYIDWLSVLLYISSFMILGYILAFGKQQDWFKSVHIKYATLSFFILAFAFFIRQKVLTRPFLSLKAFKKNNVRHGIIMLLLLGMYLATTNLQNTFAMGILGYNALTNASLNMMMIPGLLVGAIISYKWFNHLYPIRMLLFTGFASFMMYTIVMYFFMVPELNYHLWLLPQFFKGMGMGILFIVIWYYTLDKLDIPSLLSLIGFVLLWRTFISLGIFSSLFTWLQYKLQLQSLSNLAVYLDDTLLMQAGGSINLTSVQLNAILAANKIIFGFLNILGIGVLLYVLFHHYGRTKDVLTRIRMSKIGQLWISTKDREKIDEQLHT